MTGGKAMAVILAAGEGKRMKSDIPKVLHRVGGEPLLARVGRAAREAGCDDIVCVVGKGSELVRREFASEDWRFVEQTERRGTGDAVKRARRWIEGFRGDVLVLAGDVPLLRSATLRTLRERHREEAAAVTVLTARLPDPAGYGRVIRGPDGGLQAIVEHADATPEQRRVDEVNSSVYCFDADALASVLDRFQRDNAQGEEYLTDAVDLLLGDGRKAAAVAAATHEEILGVNTPEHLARIEVILAREEAP